MEKKMKKRKMSIGMKKALRRTIGAVLLISALIVLFVPEEESEAVSGAPTVTVGPADSSIPVISDTDTIYTTGDGAFQFAYVEKNSGGDKVAVIVGYDYARSLTDGKLVIPDKMDAYIKDTHSQGTEGGYAAAGKSGNVLYYPTYKTIKEDTGTVDETGAPIYVDKEIIDSYRPCLYSEYESWHYDKDGSVRAADAYYYQDLSNPQKPKYILTTDEKYQRIQNATVAYISSQHVEKTETGWQLSTTQGVGIFSKGTNIKNLVTGEYLMGIGDYAFYECASLKGITLGDGANTIGNYAFATCVNLEYAIFPTNSSILALGDHAFYNCRKLKNFTVPVAVKKIGDSAFEGCTNMTDIDLCGDGQQVLLETVGVDVFKNCTALSKLVFPDYFSQDIPLSYIYGCTSLDYIKLPHVDATLTEDTVKFADLIAMVKPEFYLEGKDISDIHTTATTNGIAFKYIDGDELYEKVFTASGSAGSGNVIYRVNDQDQLQYFHMDDTVLEVNIPEAIGPHHVTTIGSKSFQGNHNLKKIIIPSSIVTIEENAFKGCHRLADVIFSEPIQLSSIGNGAFDTQVIDPLLDSCTLDSTPKLTFTGTIDVNSLPFSYAMNSANNINRGSQPLTYITFYSGWPTNLTVTYNPTEDRTELVDYPRLSDVMSYAVGSYPYITADQAAAANAAYAKYINSQTMTQDESDIVNAALNIVIPKGIEGIRAGVFSNKDAQGTAVSASGNPDTDLMTVTAEGLKEIDPYAFAGCSKLKGAYINGDTDSIGDSAFEDCQSLIDVKVSPSVSNLGLQPFTGCVALETVEFGNSTYFTCDNSIIYGLDNGVKANLLTCLPGRGVTYGTGAIQKEELANIKAIAEGAFKGCEGILSVDLTESVIESIPNNCFENTPDLYSVSIPNTCRKVSKNAYKNSNIRYLEIPNSVNIIDPTAFENDIQKITFYCQPDSMASDYAKDYSNIQVQEKEITYKVVFYDEDAVTILDTITVKDGEDATTSVVPTKSGYKFKAWVPAPTTVHADLNTFATYESDEKTYTVTFVDFDDKILFTQQVKEATDAVEPTPPVRVGYSFTGWRPAIKNITANVTTYAQYEKNADKTYTVTFMGYDDKVLYTQTVKEGENAIDPNGPARTGYKFVGWKPAITGIKADLTTYAQYETDTTASGGSQSTTDTKLYTLTVIDGSGGGSYAEGATVTIKANTPETGKSFDKWTCENSTVVFASATTATTTFKMPAAAVTVTATFKGTASSNTNNTSSGTNTNTNNTNNSKPATQTTISVNKTGISNKDTASATVSGSTDNYVVKVTDSSAVKKEVEEALKDKYGTLDDIKYFAMDISLYDETGTTKIENTDNISVTITLPIPDDLVDYAGNNKVAYVVNGKLLELKPQYVTIDGVACVKFTATHFSPYTIYVDTSNLTAGMTPDDTPKTGDGISPKWFLAIGLACIGIVMFSIRDKKVLPKPVKSS